MKKGILSLASFLLGVVLPAFAQQPPANVPPMAPTQPPTVAQTPTASPRPAASAPAAAPRQHSLSMEASPISRGGESRALDAREASRLGYEYGSNTDPHSSRAASMTTNTNKESLQISVRNFGAAPDNVTVECYFIGQYVGEPRPKNSPGYVKDFPKEFVFDHPAQPLAIAGSSTGSLTVDSIEVRTLITKFASVSSSLAVASTKEVGTRLHAWIVRLVADGKVLAVRASNDSYEEIGKDDAKLRALVAVPFPDEPTNRRTIGPFRR